jgi:hypothetical protein
MVAAMRLGLGLHAGPAQARPRRHVTPPRPRSVRSRARAFPGPAQAVAAAPAGVRIDYAPRFLLLLTEAVLCARRADAAAAGPAHAGVGGGTGRKWLRGWWRQRRGRRRARPAERRGNAGEPSNSSSAQSAHGWV